MLRKFGLVIAISFFGFACSDAPDTIKPTPAGAGGNAATAGKSGGAATAGKDGAAAGKGGAAAAGRGGATAGKGGAAAAGKGGAAAGTGGSSEEDLDAGTDPVDGATDGGDAAAA